MKRFFGYFSLESGAIFIGILGMVGFIIQLGFTIQKAVVQYNESVLYEYDFECNVTTLHSKSVEYFYTLGFKITLFLICGIMSSIFLIYGVQKKRRYFLIPWLIFAGIFVPFGIVICIFEMYLKHIFTHTLLIIIVLGPLVYFWFGIHGLYQKMAQIDKDMTEKSIQFISSEREAPYVDFVSQ